MRRRGTTSAKVSPPKRMGSTSSPAGGSSCTAWFPLPNVSTRRPMRLTTVGTSASSGRPG